VKNMARLYEQKKQWKNSPLRAIVLVMPDQSDNVILHRQLPLTAIP
jgi:hypothetical protein